MTAAQFAKKFQEVGSKVEFEKIEKEWKSEQAKILFQGKEAEVQEVFDRRKEAISRVFPS